MLDKKVIRKSLIVIAIILLILIGITLIRRTFSRYESNSESAVPTDMALWIVNEGFVSEEINIGEIIPIPKDTYDAHLLSVLDGSMEIETVLGKEYVKDYRDYIKPITFSIQNYNEKANGDVGLVSSVPLKYEIKITATTNMPLEYKLYQYNNDNITLNSIPCVVTDEPVQDDDGTWYRQITAVNGGANDFLLDAGLEADVNAEKDTFLLLIWLPDNENDAFTDASYENNILADLMEHIKIEIKAEQRMSGEVTEVEPTEPEPTE